jgi:2-polyprenyl-6-methoxyphenol hydroxylase-like FAD-dependent oxidoreductase
MPRMLAFEILVRGGGVVGLTAALALARQGTPVALLAPESAAPRDDVRAYALNAASVQLLASMKVWDALPADARTPVHDMRIEGDVPGAALDFSAWAQGAGELAFIADAAALEQALHAAVRFAPHVSVVPGDVPAALQVLADGRDSPARRALNVGMPLHRYGQRAIAARLHSDQAHAGLARQWFRNPDVLALLPLDRPQAGRSFALVWSLPETRAAELMALSESAFNAALMDATGGAAGHLVLASARADWPLAVGRAERTSGAGWVLVGDAAHVVHPLAGQGLNLGLADVQTLARVLAEREPWRRVGDPKLLRRYARKRETPTRAMIQLTDGLLQLFASPQPLVKELRNRGLTLVNHLPAIKRLLTRRALGG